MCDRLALSPTGRQRYVVQDCGHETPCWVWQMAVAPNGYGLLWVDGVGTGAHQFFYERLVGDIPTGAVLDHKCRNRRCVNPDHLETVTQAENVRRGRLAKLTQADVDQIRALITAGGANTQIARSFSVSRRCISDIRTGRRWATPGGVVHAAAA